METIKLTDAAQLQAQTLLLNDSEPKDGLRIAIIGGGCSGNKYKLGWDDAQEDDLVHQYPNGVKILIDPKSAPLLAGCTLEFHDELNKSGFEVINPNAHGCCGCGNSFST